MKITVEERQELMERMAGRVNGVAMVSLGRGDHPRIPDEIVPALADIAIAWFEDRRRGQR